ncbi:MAG: sigma-70 family RNA polymerase sigma factor [Chloroflexi bacterium]|nr:sigma-70 family RNA polymerase sigma factor [Chloroflexota bacterium]
MTTVLRLTAADAKRAGAETVNWREVFDAELPRIMNYFRYRVDDDMLAEDLTAETFERAWRARDTYRRDRAAFSTWLFTIARHIAVDHYRRRSRSTEEPLDTLDEAGAAAPSPAEAAEQHDEITRLRALLADLPARERELVALKYGAGLNNREIARMTSLSESNVGTILHRAVAQLRLILAL